MRIPNSKLTMPLCPCFRPKDPQKEKDDVVKRLNVILVGEKLNLTDFKPGQIIDNSEVFGPCDPFHKISVEKIGLWTLKTYIKYGRDDEEIESKCWTIITQLGDYGIYLKVPNSTFFTILHPTFKRNVCKMIT